MERALRETTVCSAVTIFDATTIGSTLLSGRAPCAPLPTISMSNMPAAAIIGPEWMAKVPTGTLGRL